MAQRKGQTGNPAGRPKGTPNKVTMEIRQAFQNLIELNTPNMIGWLEEVAATDPAKALNICSDLAEFIIPKLARTTLVGDPENPIRTEQLVILCDNADQAPS